MSLSEEEELELLTLERERAAAGTNHGMANPPLSMMDTVGQIAKNAAQTAVASDPAQLSNEFFKTDPATMQRVGGPALPIMGGVAGAPFGLAAPGAALGELARQVTGTAFAPDTVPKTGLGRAASAITAGVAEEPKILKAIPGVPKVAEMASNLVSKALKGLAKAGQTLSGAKADILTQGARQGLSTYLDESLPEAQSIFSKALGPKGESAIKETAKEAFDSALTKARKVAVDIGTKIENGEPVTALEALKARQATDRVISSTPITDKVTRKALYGWRNQFDNELASQSGKLADASRTYRRAIVKDTLLSPTRLNKSGEPSAFLPMLVGHGMMGKGLEGGLGMLTGTSPAVWGLGATAGGSALRGLNKLGENPATRQILMQVLQKIMQSKKGGTE